MDIEAGWTKHDPLPEHGCSCPTKTRTEQDIRQIPTAINENRGEGRTYQEQGVSRAGRDRSRMCSVLQRHPGESRRAGALGSLAPWWEREEMCSEKRTHKCKHTCQRAKEL